MRDIDPQVAQLFEDLKSAAFAESPSALSKNDPPLLTRNGPPARLGRDDNTLPTYGLRTEVRGLGWSTLNEQRWSISGERRGTIY